MKTGMAALFLFLLAVSQPAGRRAMAAGSDTMTFTAQDAFAFDFPEDWRKSPHDTPYDLQCLSGNGEFVTGVFVYDERDFTGGIAPDAIFRLQVEDMRMKRRNFRFVEEARNTEGSGKRIVTSVYSGDIDKSRHYYIFSLVEFDGESKFAVVLQICAPSRWKENKDLFGAIIESCRPIGPGGGKGRIVAAGRH